MTWLQRHVVILLTNLIAVLFLLFTTDTDGADSYARLLHTSRHLEAVESHLERDAVRIRSLSLRNFDTLVEGRRERDTALASLGADLASVGAVTLRGRAETAQAENRNSDLILDQLTRSASKLNNARAALPAFTQDLVEELTATPGHQPIIDALEALLEAVALYALNPTADTTRQVDIILADLSNAATSPVVASLRDPADFGNALTIARIVRDETRQLGALADSYVARDLPGAYDRLHDELAVLHERAVAHLQRTVPLLHILMLVLLAHAAYLLISLIAANKRLALYADDLEVDLDRERLMNEQQRRFVTTISHEFRTPLAIIDVFAQRVLRSPERATAATLTRGMTTTRTAIRRLVHLLETTLHVNRLREEGLEPNRQSFNLQGLIQGILKEQRAEADEHTFEVDIAALPTAYPADRKLLQHVFTNSIGNAVKYSPHGGTVSVTATSDGSDLIVEITDSGIGIPEGEVDHLFAQYSRGSNAAGISGAGVSLHLSKEIVERHGGSIALSSVEDEGTTVTVRLPVSPRSAPDLQAAAEQDAARLSQAAAQ